MVQNTQPTAIEKPWYKKWWGVLIIFLTWPISVPLLFLIIIWKRANIGSPVKMLLSAIVVIFFGALYASVSSSQPSPVTNSTPSEKKVVAVFDVPSLVGLENIDEVKNVLGTPTIDTEPTQRQIEIGTDGWGKTWDRENADLYVTYDERTRKIIDFFVSGVDPSGVTSDKALLLAVSGAKEDDPRYQVEFVAAINSPGKYTGIKITPTAQ